MFRFIERERIGLSNGPCELPIASRCEGMFGFIPGSLRDGAQRGMQPASKVLWRPDRPVRRIRKSNGRKTMNRNEVEGNWKQLKGKAQEKWGELTDDDLDQVEGKREQLVGKLQERYGKSQKEASKEVDEFFDSLDRHVKR